MVCLEQSLALLRKIRTSFGLIVQRFVRAWLIIVPHNSEHEHKYAFKRGRIPESETRFLGEMSFLLRVAV